MLDVLCHEGHELHMTEPAIELDINEAEAERKALAAAVSVARADQRGVPHNEMRDWLLKVASGNFKAEPPKAKPL